MNTSKDLEQQASLEENDIKAMALHIKALREKRSERFIEDRSKPITPISYYSQSFYINS